MNERLANIVLKKGVATSGNSSMEDNWLWLYQQFLLYLALVL